MQALTKTPPIEPQVDTVSIYVTIPKIKLGTVKTYLEGAEAQGTINRIYDDNEWVDARKYFDLDNPNKKYDFVKGYRYREDMTQKQLSEKTGIPIRHISEMENGKRTIGKANAKKLATALNCDYRRFL